ncbi:hypothetical protein EVAR_93527_1 [Eumeta japonica]|uniref:Uncharacterized protein n=1 Tax=Eumeta variegata TaxID=151549 RepID=A0A4C2A9N4_EUMVA|nr:hypothetical protein EVAR_93527_1 [Eumeta japonica]
MYSSESNCAGIVGQTISNRATGMEPETESRTKLKPESALERLVSRAFALDFGPGAVPVPILYHAFYSDISFTLISDLSLDLNFTPRLASDSNSGIGYGSDSDEVSDNVLCYSRIE